MNAATLPLFSTYPMHTTPVEPPRVADQVLVGERRAVVTHVDAERDNPREDVVLCVTWLDNGRDGVVFWGEVTVTFRR